MPIYELITPHDPYHFKAPDRLTAALVAFIVGRGWYGAREVLPKSEEPWRTPIMNGWEEFLKETGWDPETDMAADLQQATCEAAKTLHICKASELEGLLALDLEDQQKHHDKARTSMSDVRRSALSMRPSTKSTAPADPVENVN